MRIRLSAPVIASWLLAASGVCAVFANSASAQSIGSITVFSEVPSVPGFPEGIAINGNRVFVSGPARFGTAGTGPSAIQVFDRSNGSLITTIEVAGEDLSQEHALSNIAIDGDGRIYALSTQLGVLRFTKVGHSYEQSSYGAPLPNLPSCGTALPGDPCSPTQVDFPPLPNDLVFDDAGNLYVTDSLQATIFRYSPGGGVPSIWFQSSLLEGGGPIPFGLNGIRIDPTQSFVYFVASTNFVANNEGTVYRLPLVNNPNEIDLESIKTYYGFEVPDQLAFAADGRLYVSLAISNQISVLDVAGNETARISSQPGDEIGLDAPAAMAFDNASKSLLIANHGLLTGTNFAVLELHTGHPGAELSGPSVP